jgi:glycosyltransferase involved in cell wall biosynthesis
MHRVLLVSATFPPRGGSGVQRVYYQSELLSRLGYDVWVVTEDAAKVWVRDDTQQCSGAHVTRVPMFSGAFGRLRQRLGRRLPFVGLYPDDHGSWRRGAFHAAARIIETEAIDSILVSYGSPSALDVAQRLKRQFPKVRLIIDIRDMRVGNMVTMGERFRWNFLKKLVDRYTERRGFAVANSVITVSNNHRTVYQNRYSEFNIERYDVIQNGYDSDLFETAEPINEAGSHLVIRYTGFLLPDQLPEMFFKALAELKSQKYGPADIRCEFYGGSSEYVERMAQSAGVSDLVFTEEYVDHGQAISLMKGADTLLLFWTNDPGCMCGKFYEYIAAKRYILAMDQGNIDARNVLAEFGRGEWLPVTECGKIARKLISLIELKKKGREILERQSLPDASSLSRQNQAKTLAEIITAGRPPTENPQTC